MNCIFSEMYPHPVVFIRPTSERLNSVLNSTDSFIYIKVYSIQFNTFLALYLRNYVKKDLQLFVLAEEILTNFWSPNLVTIH